MLDFPKSKYKYMMYVSSPPPPPLSHILKKAAESAQVKQIHLFYKNIIVGSA